MTSEINKQLEFEMYRVLLEIPPQRDLFLEEAFPPRNHALAKSLEEKPSMEISRALKWSLGNIKEGKDGYIYFLTGKTSLKKQEVFNPETRDFNLEFGPDSPFTICILNPVTGVFAICRKSKLSPKTETVAKRIRQLIEYSLIDLQYGYQVKVKTLSDPFGFLERVSACHAVRRFKFWISPSNPIDIEGRFHKTNKELVDETGAREGAVALRGDELDKKIIRRIAISVNSVGDNATANIQTRPKDKGTNISMKGNPFKLLLTEEEVEAGLAGSRISAAYERITGNQEE